MIDIILSYKGKGPIYMQLYNQIRDMIREHILMDGMKLPSIRSLQLQMQLSKTTVESAYHLLLTEGYDRTDHNRIWHFE